MVSARGALFGAALLCLLAPPGFSELKTTPEISTGASWDELNSSLHVSGGLYRAFDLGGPGSLSARAEAAIVPCGEWGEIFGGLPAGSPGYGALLFTDLTYAPSDAFAASARSLLSPVDASGLVLLEVSWQVCRDNDLAFLVTLKYRF